MSTVDLRIIEVTDAIRAIIDESGEMKLLVLGAPYGGTKNGKDSYGTYFSDKTNFMVEVGETRPVVYYHGFNPEGKPDFEPEVIGKAIVKSRDQKGLWFEVVLNQASELAKRIWEASKKGLAKASSGAVAHLTRFADDGEILTWPIGELSLMDVNKWRKPANDLAIAVPLKAIFEKAELDLPQIFIEGDEPKIDIGEGKEAVTKNLLNKEIIGTMDAIDTKEVAIAVKALIDAEAKAQKEKEDEITKAKQEAVEDYKKELEAKVPAWKGGFNTKKVTSLGLKDDAKSAYLYWIKTGDESAYRAAAPMNEGTPANGGYAVPDDHYNQIVEKRDEMSIARKMGATVITTTRDVMNVPVENSEMGAFSPISEATDVATAHENEPTLDQKAITVFTFRNLVKVSQELMEDDGSNLEQFLMNSFSRKLAEAENKYFITGAGTTEPEGVMGLAATYNLVAASGISPNEIPGVYYDLPQPYRDGACWVMNGATEGYLRGLNSSNVFTFGYGAVDMKPGLTNLETLMGKPVFNNSNVATIAHSAKTILFGNFKYYGLVERKGLTVIRLNERFADTGQIGLLAIARFGGAPLQSEAFAIAAQA